MCVRCVWDGCVCVCVMCEMCVRCLCLYVCDVRCVWDVCVICMTYVWGMCAYLWSVYVRCMCEMCMHELTCIAQQRASDLQELEWQVIVRTPGTGARNFPVLCKSSKHSFPRAISAALGSLTEPGAHHFRKTLAKELQGSSRHHLPCTRSTAKHHTGFLCRCCGFELRASCLCGKHYCDWVNTPAPPDFSHVSLNYAALTRL